MRASTRSHLKATPHWLHPTRRRPRGSRVQQSPVKVAPATRRWLLSSAARRSPPHDSSKVSRLAIAVVPPAHRSARSVDPARRPAPQQRRTGRRGDTAKSAPPRRSSAPSSSPARARSAAEASARWSSSTSGRVLRPRKKSFPAYQRSSTRPAAKWSSSPSPRRAENAERSNWSRSQADRRDVHGALGKEAHHPRKKYAVPTMPPATSSTDGVVRTAPGYEDGEDAKSPTRSASSQVGERACASARAPATTEPPAR